MATNLPTDIAGSYPDRSQGDRAHQQHHDTLHGAVNELTDTVETGRLSDTALTATYARVSAVSELIRWHITPATAPDDAWVHWGDSTTDNYSSSDWVGKFASLTDLPHFGGGVGGDTSTQIKTRQTADSTYRARRFTIGAGRNDFKTETPETIVGNVTAMLDHFTARRDGFVLDVPPWSNETLTATGTSGEDRAKLDTLNALLADTFPTMHLPAFAWLRTDEAAAAAGITFTAGDLTDIADGVTPRSFRWDGGHLNALGAAALYYYIATAAAERGYTTDAPAPLTIYAADHFQRANSTSLGATDIGGYAWGSDGGTWDISGNNLRVQGASSTVSAAWVTAATHQDGRLSAKLTNVGTGLYWRAAADNTGYVAYASGGNYVIAKRTGIYSHSAPLATSAGITPAFSDHLAVECEGSTHRLYVNGRLACTVTDTTYTGTRFGFWKLNTGTATFDGFEWAAIPAAA